jgi:hypothetical protein
MSLDIIEENWAKKVISLIKDSTFEIKFVSGTDREKIKFQIMPLSN